MPEAQNAQKVTAPAKGQETNNGYNPFAYYWSSTTVSFAALMELLKAAQEAYNDMAKCSVTTTNAQGNAVVAGANATQTMYQKDATSTLWQMGEQISSCVTSGIGMVMSVKAMNAPDITNATTKLANLRTVAQEAKVIDGTLPAIGDGPQPPRVPGTAEFEAARRNVEFDRDYTARGLREPVQGAGNNANGNPMTLEDVVRSLPANGQEGEYDVRGFRRDLVDDIRSQTDELLSATNRVTQRTQMWSTFTQGVNAGLTGGMKGGEAVALSEKADAAKDQALKQAGQEFMRETNQSQKDQYNQYSQESGEVFKTIERLVGVDAKG